MALGANVAPARNKHQQELKSNDRLGLNEDILHDEQDGEHVERGVEALPVAAQHIDGHVGDDTTQNAVGDAIRERHHDDRDEGRDRLGVVVQLDVFDGRQHEQSHDDEHGSRGSRRDGQEQRREEQRHHEAERRRQRREARAATLRHASGTLHVGRGGACAQAGARHGGYGIGHERLVQAGDGAVGAHHARLGAHANQRAHGVEHIDEEERQHHDHHVDGEDVVKLKLAEDGRHRGRHVHHAMKRGEAHRHADERRGDDADEERAGNVLDDQHRRDEQADDAEQRRPLREVADGYKRGVVLHDDARVLQADEGDEEADARANGPFEGGGNGVDDECAYLRHRHEDEEDALDEDGRQGKLP